MTFSIVARAGNAYGQSYADPVGKLARLLDLHTMLFGKPEPDALRELVGPLADEVGALLSGTGHPVAGSTSAALDAALASWAGIENLEERIVPGKIDPLVLAHLRASAG